MHCGGILILRLPTLAKLFLVAREHDVAVLRPVVLQSLLTDRRSFVDHMQASSDAVLAVYDPEPLILQFILLLRDNFHTLGCRHDGKGLLVKFVGLLQ